MTSDTGGAHSLYKAGDEALSLVTGFLCAGSASLQALVNAMLWGRQCEILSFTGGFRAHVFIMPVLVLPQHVVTITEFFHRSNPQVRMYKTGEMVSCLSITLVRVLKIELSQPLVYRSNQVFDDLWSGS